ncbi:SPOR domain-containing protein [Rhodoferax bucti]|uniref:SPOR domain-containing protein n=1 Tax=Rhodoferax bucti TaxID=2576305 RepID=UPI001108FC85|nr:SPOR domain-containing protein [Rhodoferax bucti]
MATAPTTALDNTDEHSTTALYRAAIGDISNGYYLPRFTRFEAADRPGLSWNWAAALNTLNWLMFRQLWHAALVYSGSIVALALLLFGIGKLVFQFSEGTQWGLLAALVGLAFVVPGLGGNALYYLATRQRVQNALAKNQTVPEACAQLTQEASTRKGLIILAACNAVALAVGAQSYAMFSGFEPLPAGTPVAVSPAPEARNVASGRAVDATTVETTKPTVSTAPAPVASAAVAAASAASNSRQAASSAVAATAASAAASAPAAKAPPIAPSASASTAAAPKAATTASAPTSAPQAKASAPAASAAQKPASASTPTRPAAQAVVAPTTPAASSAPKASAKATPDKPSATKADPVPTPLRSAAAANAAREVAAALGQSAPAVQATPRAAAAVPAPAIAISGRFVVNVGLFADSNNARNALVKLMDAELPVVSKEVRFPKGNRTRIQVGPFDTLAEADAAADKVRALELEARVAPAP